MLWSNEIINSLTLLQLFHLKYSQTQRLYFYFYSLPLKKMCYSHLNSATPLPAKTYRCNQTGLSGLELDNVTCLIYLQNGDKSWLLQILWGTNQKCVWKYICWSLIFPQSLTGFHVLLTLILTPLLQKPLQLMDTDNSILVPHDCWGEEDIRGSNGHGKKYKY